VREKQGSKTPISKSSTSTKPTTPKTTAAAEAAEAAETTTSRISSSRTAKAAYIRQIPLLGVADPVPDTARGSSAPQHFSQQYTEPQV